MSTEGMYGHVVLTVPLRRVQRAIDSIVDTIESSVSKHRPIVPAPSPPPPPHSLPVAVCPWGLMNQPRCKRNTCSLPDESHASYIHSLVCHLDTSPRILTAAPPFCDDFTFVVCRTPSAESTQYLCSLCVPNTDRVRGYVVGFRGRMRQCIEIEAGTTVNCNRGPVAMAAQWMTVSAAGELAAVDAVVEAIVYIHEVLGASTEQVVEHMQQWRQQRASKVDRPMLWSLQSRGALSAQLDSLFAPSIPHRDVHPSEQPSPAGSGSSHTAPPSSPAVPSSTELCSTYLLSCCNNSHCGRAHMPNKSYAEWLAECLRSGCDHIKKLAFWSPHFYGTLSPHGGSPLQPLLLSLPIPYMIASSDCIRAGGPLISTLQQLMHVYINVPRTDVDQAKPQSWGMLRARGDTRQVDAMIEWCCWLMDDWKATGGHAAYVPDKQYRQAKRLRMYMEHWLGQRAQYVAEPRELESKVRLSFTLPSAVVKEEIHCAEGSSHSSGTTLTPPHSRSDDSHPTPSLWSPSSQTSTNSSSSDVSSSSAGSAGSSDSRDSGSSTSVPASPPPSASSPAQPSFTTSRSHSPPVDPVRQLDSMRATGLRLNYHSFVQHPSFSATSQPLIRILPDQAFGYWPIPVACRDEFVYTADEQAVPLIDFEQQWKVDVYVPAIAEAAGGCGGGGMQWCNVCVRMADCSVEEKETGSAVMMVAAGVMDSVMLAIMQRAKRVEQLLAAH